VKFLHGNSESEGSQMAQSHPLQELYDREINFKIETLWDGGFDVALVDAMHGYVARGNAKTFEEAVRWLVDHADNPLGSLSASSSLAGSTHRHG
jgi:hypothetical protein